MKLWIKIKKKTNSYVVKLSEQFLKTYKKIIRNDKNKKQIKKNYKKYMKMALLLNIIG